MDLLDTALRARANAHAPYSGFKVGAAIRCPDGSVFAGCNVENVAYPEGTCAEAGAIAAMVAAGAREIAEVLVVADSPTPVTPCGGCRQKLAEFAAARGAGDPRRPRRRARPHHGRRAAARRLRRRRTWSGPSHDRPSRRRRPGARLPRPHQPRRGLRRRRDRRALRPRPHAARAGRRGLRLARLRRPGARACSRGTGIRVATVVNFPTGDDDLICVREETRAVIFDGADEIDMVVPWRALPRASPRRRRDGARGQRGLRGSRTLKAILETGELKRPGPDPPRRRRGAGRRRRLPEDLDRQGPGQRHPRGRGDPARGDPRLAAAPSA